MPPGGGEERSEDMELVPQDCLKKGFIRLDAEANEIKRGGRAYPPGDRSPEGSLEAELVCLRDIPPPAG